MLKSVTAYLQKTNHGQKVQDFEEHYTSHPNYPSLYAITDTLSLLNIDNVAASVPKDQLEELPDLFLAYVSSSEKGNEIALIDKANNIIGVTFDGKKKKKFSNEEFKNLWNGIIIAIESSDETTNNTKTSSSLNKITYLTIALLALFLIKQGKTFTLEATISFLSYLTGFVLSIFIIQEKLNKGEESISKLCSFNSKASCDSVIKSTQTKINEWLDFSDLPLLFFSVSLISMLIDTSAYLIINAVSLLSIPVVIYSLWLQKAKLNKWCVLCLAVSVVLLLQTVLVFKSGYIFQNNLYNLAVAIVIATPLWFFIKDNLVRNLLLEKSNTELKRFKRNYKVFEMLQRPLKKTRFETDFSTIGIGSPENPIEISIVLSPSCGHCHTAFEQALNLYQKTPEKIRISVFFNLNPENKDNAYLDVAKSIIQINLNNRTKVIDALSDWHIKKMNLNDWLQKWKPVEIEDYAVENLKTQYEWCLKNEFNYTPVKIINDREYPKEYDLGELRYFLSEIEEEKAPLEMV